MTERRWCDGAKGKTRSRLKSKGVATGERPLPQAAMAFQLLACGVFNARLGCWQTASRAASGSSKLFAWCVLAGCKAAPGLEGPGSCSRSHTCMQAAPRV